MTRAAPWGDPAVEAGFAAAYTASYASSSLAVEEAAVEEAAVEDTAAVDPATAPPAEPVPTPQDELDEAADRAARPLTRTGRPARAPQPARLSPTRAVAGAAVSVAGVVLGIGTLLWISDDPTRGAGPVVQAPLDEIASGPEVEAGPVDPPPSAAAPAPVAPAPAAPAPVDPPPAAAPSVVVPVLVLNNSRIPGLADRAAEQFRAAGWPVRDTGNFRGRIRATTIYYPSGQQDSAQEFARRFRGIERVLPRFEGLPGSGLTVVLTRDFA